MPIELPQLKSSNPRKKQKATIRAERDEKERVQRLAKKQKEFSGVILDDNTTNLALTPGIFLNNFI